jgi:hypothetical protein
LAPEQQSPKEADMHRFIQILGTFAINAIPLAGVIWFGWNVFEVLLVYWFENVAIGAAHAARLGICTWTNGTKGGWGTTAFFAAHYGLFTLVHGIFVVAYFGILSEGFLGLKGGLGLPVVSIFGWQALLLLLDTTASQRFKGRDPSSMMFEPYPRVFALHVTVILGGFLIDVVGAPIWALAVLVVVKTISDVFIGLVLTPGGRTPEELLAALRKLRD